MGGDQEFLQIKECQGITFLMIYKSLSIEIKQPFGKYKDYI